MSELALKRTTVSLPQPLWKQIVEMAKVQGYKTSEVIQEALKNYVANQLAEPILTSDEKKAAILQRLYAARVKRKLAHEKAIAEGKMNPLPPRISIEQVRAALSGIEDSLAKEVIKERGEGW